MHYQNWFFFLLNCPFLLNIHILMSTKLWQSSSWNKYRINWNDCYTNDLTTYRLHYYHKAQSAEMPQRYDFLKGLNQLISNSQNVVTYLTSGHIIHDIYPKIWIISFKKKKMHYPHFFFFLLNYLFQLHIHILMSTN